MMIAIKAPEVTSYPIEECDVMQIFKYVRRWGNEGGNMSLFPKFNDEE